MNYKRKGRLLALCLSMVLVTGCGAVDTANQNAVESSDVIEYDDNDWYTAVSEADSEVINLDEQTDKVKITKAGTYMLKGSLQGQIEVAVTKNDTVRLILTDVNITAADGPAILCTQCEKLIISLPKGTKNTISDGKTYSDQSTDAADAAIFAQDDLTINGVGALTINGNYADAVKTKDTLKLMSGTIAVTAVDDGFTGKDFLYVHAGTYTIKSGGDGLKTTYDTDDTKGDMIIENGLFTIDAGGDGIQSEHRLDIYDGSYTLTTGGGSENSETAKNAFEPGGFGRWQQDEGNASSTDTASAKGIKANAALAIHGGSFKLDTSDDSLHTNGDLSIADGNFTLASGDDGMHSDGTLTIDNGTVEITASYEGIEGSTVIINGGDLLINAMDDGINAAGGSDSDNEAQPSPDHFAAGDHTIEIHGGSVQVDADGDGVDANGALIMDGGSALICGSEDGGNSALDFDQSCELNGGVLIALGNSSMAQAPSSTSTQNVISATLPTQAAKSITYLTDSEGNVIIGAASSHSYSHIIISSPKLESSATYSLCTGGSSGNVNDRGYVESEVSGGTQTASLTLNERITGYGSANGNSDMPQGNPGGGRGDFSDRPTPPMGEGFDQRP